MVELGAPMWDSVADGWERHASALERFKAPVTAAMLRGLAVQPGEQVLELGAGPGELARSLAGLVGDGGRVVMTDVAPAMVAAAGRALVELPQASAVVADAADLTAFGEEFDAAAFRMGLMFVPEPMAALREIRRVLRPGGRLAVAVWGPADANPWMLNVGMAVVLSGLPFTPPIGPGGPFCLGAADELEQLAKDAGFDELVVEEIDLLLECADAAAHVEMPASLTPGLGAVLTGASAEQQEAVVAAVAEADERFRTATGLAIPGRALVLHARR